MLADARSCAPPTAERDFGPNASAPGATTCEAAAELDRMLVEYAFSVPVRHLERGRLPPHIAAAQFDRNVSLFSPGSIAEVGTVPAGAVPKNPKDHPSGACTEAESLTQSGSTADKRVPQTVTHQVQA